MNSLNRSLVQPLFVDPIDVVGDVHGEIDALHHLLRRLGYDASGDHPEGRRLVFLGDLTDRGPDSPAVVALVARLVQSGRAECLLGNHDLNILLGHKKHDNWWFYGEAFRADGSPWPQRLADEPIRASVTAFFATLPLALERDDVRVVHACWDDEMIGQARRATDALELYRRSRRRIEDEHAGRPELDDVERGLERQNRNPVKVLTSGKERRVSPPFWASGKLRHEERVRWWEGYERVPCLFGHYAFGAEEDQGGGPAFCVDFGVGNRWTERLAPGFDGSFRAKLGAVRLPERRVVLNDQTSYVIGERAI
jgi:hypothetical protein